VNRRLFLASLFAPFVAKAAPSPTWSGMDVASGPALAIVTIRYTAHDLEFLDYRAFTVSEIARQRCSEIRPRNCYPEMVMADALEIARQMLYEERARTDARDWRLALPDMCWRVGFRARCELLLSSKWREQSPISHPGLEYPSTLLGLPFEANESIPLDELRLMSGDELLASRAVGSAGRLCP
jgi:hypothetical protein